MLKLAVIGDPIEHSKSPEIHGAVMERLGIECEYVKTHVKSGELEGFVSRAKSDGLNGFNVTMPHKVDIIPFLDEIASEAREYNSVNTVKIENGRLYGYNTDGSGFYMSIKDNGASVAGSEVVFLGAGGVVNTLAQKMAMESAKSITILNRSQDKAAELCAVVRKKFGVSTCFGALNDENICKAAVNCDILINATPLGMSGVDNDFDNFGFLDKLKIGAFVSDLIYNPPVTRLLYEAEKRGFKIVNGMGMLIYQALIADEIYTGQKIEYRKMFVRLSENWLDHKI